MSCVRAVEISISLKSSRTSQAAPLMANRGQLNAIFFGRVPNVLVLPNRNLFLGLWHEQRNSMGLHSNFSLQLTVSGPSAYANEPHRIAPEPSTDCRSRD